MSNAHLSSFSGCCSNVFSLGQIDGHRYYYSPVPMGGSRRGTQGAHAPFKAMAGRSGRIGSVLLAWPARFQNALKHA